VDDDPTVPASAETIRASEAALDTPLAAGTMVGRYQIVERLGQGGMGVVYRALDVELERAVALKLVRGQLSSTLDDLTERLRRESRLQARAQHPCVITVHDIGRDDDRVYVAMELAKGGTLRTWLKQRHSWREIVDVFRRAGEGLAAAHAAGLVHRDFKPDNVLLDLDGERVLRVLVSDFGVARAVEAAEKLSGRPSFDLLRTTPGALVGTPAYMAPEQLAASTVDARTDLFAFAVGLWEALHGTRPYTGNSLAELVVAMQEPLADPPRDGVPRWLDHVLRRALAIDPQQRPASMAELLTALDWRRRRSHGWLRAGAVAAALTALGVVTAVVIRSRPVATACDRTPEFAATLTAARDHFRAATAHDPPGLVRPWESGLEVFQRRSLQLRSDVCKASPRAANFQARVECIDRSASDGASYVERMVGDPHRLELLTGAPFPAPYECASDAATAMVRRWTDPDKRATAMRMKADAIYATILAAKQPDDARVMVERLQAEAAKLGMPRVEHELALDRAMLTWRGLPADIESIRDIAAAAERDGSTYVAAYAWVELATLQFHLDYKRAQDLLTEADVAIERAGNPPRLRATWHALEAYALAQQSKTEEAEHHVAAAEDIVKRDELPLDLRLLAELGDAETRGGRSDKALAFHKAAFDALADRPEDDDTRGYRQNYAGALMASGKPDEAYAVCAPLVASADPAHATNNMLSAAVMLAVIDNQLGHFEDALAIAAKWQPVLEKAGSTQRAVLAVQRATALVSLGRFDDAEKASQHAVELYVESVGASNYDTADARVLHGQALAGLGRLDEARDEIARGAKDLTAAAGEGDPLTLQAKVQLADVLARQKHYPEALATLEPIIDAYDRLMPDAATRALADLTLAESLAATGGDPARVKTLATSILSVLQSAEGDNQEAVARAKALLR
jgi:tetratricopeptide (TPR) repeat protein